MKALVKEKPEPGLSLLDVSEPQIESPDDVKFKVEYCAICVGETKVYDWNEWAANDPTLKIPTVIGHEAVGIITEVGSGVKNFKPGDRIVNDPLISCGVCRQCRSGYTNMCEQREIYGKQRGAFAEYAVLPAHVICSLHPKLSLEEGAILENFGIAMRSVEVIPHDVGDWAVVIGAGPIGILAAQVLTAQGVNTIITELSEARLAFARQQTRAIVIDIKETDPVQAVADLTSGRGADFVIEMLANQKAIDQAFDMVPIRGTVVTIGTFNQPISFNPFFKMTRREINLLSIMGRTWETWRRMNQLVGSDQVSLAPLVSCILPMDKYREGFEMVKDYSIQKVLLKP